MRYGGEHPFQRLSEEWRARATMFRSYGADAAAKTLEECARELELGFETWLDQPLTLDEAAAESGYSYSSLQKRVSNQELPNAGDKGTPRVRRRHLPYKPRVEPGGGIADAALLRRLV
jgi:hypothetical protein